MIHKLEVMGLELRVRSCLGYELLIRLAFFFFCVVGSIEWDQRFDEMGVVSVLELILVYTSNVVIGAIDLCRIVAVALGMEFFLLFFPLIVPTTGVTV